MGKQLEKLLKESIKADDAFISVEKKGNSAKVNVRGNKAGILIALVSLENHILNELNISIEEYLIITSIIGIK